MIKTIKKISVSDLGKLAVIFDDKETELYEICNLDKLDLEFCIKHGN